MGSVKALIIAGTHSGVGKTTVATGLMYALTKRGHKVQGYKAGPDYIDPTYHKLATGRPSRNLDTWLCNTDVVRNLFERSANELNIIEGVMGLFDGAAGGRGSTAELAKLLGIPVALVVDASAMAQSVGALTHGFSTFDPEVKVSGVIFNKVDSEGHYNYLCEAIKITPLGWIRNNKEITLPERHLGLIPAEERAPDIEKIGNLVSEHINLDKVIELAGNYTLPEQKMTTSTGTKQQIRIAYAHDQAINLYYEDNLDIMRDLGAETIPFSPLNDRQLPECDLLYICGGFPELYSEQLKSNSELSRQIRGWKGPIYAECGGLIYLTLIGKIPGEIEMRKSLQNFGYSTATALTDTILLQKGESIRGHEFHYSTWDGPANAYSVEKYGESRLEGYANGNILATYIHVHFGSNMEAAQRLIQSAKAS